MKLAYEFVPIDVKIVIHPRADLAGPEAMGLWLWGMAYAKANKTGGRLQRRSVLNAWTGKRNVMLAKRLVEAGLWLARDDGDWDIFNFDVKGPAKKERTPGAIRTERWRHKERHSDAVTENSGDVTVTRHCSLSLSNSISSDLSEGVQGEGDAGPPDWFAGVLATIEMATGERLDPGPSWLRYRGHRANKRAPMNVRDAEYWLTTVVVPERKRDREETHRRKERDAERDEAFRREKFGPPVKPLPSVAPLIRERAEWERTAASPEEQAASAAKLQKLLGGVGR